MQIGTVVYKLAKHKLIYLSLEKVEAIEYYNHSVQQLWTTEVSPLLIYDKLENKNNKKSITVFVLRIFEPKF